MQTQTTQDLTEHYKRLVAMLNALIEEATVLRQDYVARRAELRDQQKRRNYSSLELRVIVPAGYHAKVEVLWYRRTWGAHRGQSRSRRIELKNRDLLYTPGKLRPYLHGWDDALVLATEAKAFKLRHALLAVHGSLRSFRKAINTIDKVAA